MDIAWLEEFGTSAVVFLLMLMVGIETRGDNLKRSLAAPRLLFGSIVGQLLLIPTIAFLLVLLAGPPDTVAMGLVLIAVSPAGAISNYYVYLARGNTELSILLTATASFLAFLTIPFYRAVGLALFPDLTFGGQIPGLLLTRNLVALTVVPIAAGMLFKRLLPGFTRARRRTLRLASMALLAAMVVLVVAARWRLLVGLAIDSLLLSVLFTIFTLWTGYSLAALLGGSRKDRIALAVEFPCRNFAIALLLAITIGQLDFAAFGVFLFVVQAVLISSSALVYDRLRGREPP